VAATIAEDQREAACLLVLLALALRVMLVSPSASARLHCSRVCSEQADELVALAEEQGFPFWRVAGMIFRGWAKVKNGNVTEGLPLLRSASTALRASGAELWMPYAFALLANACETGGQLEEALTHLGIALQIVERTGERWFAAELNRRKGQLLLRQGHTEAAEELYREALSIAEEQEAKLWELRAAVSLARLCRDRGRRVEARDLLAPVYGWFTEGFGTPDLKDAKALLNELGGARHSGAAGRSI
jgi:predicted ATPase